MLSAAHTPPLGEDRGLSQRQAALPHRRGAQGILLLLFLSFYQMHKAKQPLSPRLLRPDRGCFVSRPRLPLAFLPQVCYNHHRLYPKMPLPRPVLPGKRCICTFPAFVRPCGRLLRYIPVSSCQSARGRSPLGCGPSGADPGHSREGCRRRRGVLQAARRPTAPYHRGAQRRTSAGRARYSTARGAAPGLRNSGGTVERSGQMWIPALHPV